MAKFDITKLNELLTKGHTITEAAKILGVNRTSIWKRCKRLKINTSKIITLEKAGQIVEKKIDAVEQLQKINQNANELLDLLMRWNRGDEEALQILESQVRKVRVGKKIKFVKEYKFKDPRELAIRAMGEIRGQLALQLEIFKALFDVSAASEFQEEVLSAIGEVSQDVREKIIRKLKERKALRSAFSIS